MMKHQFTPSPGLLLGYIELDCTFSILDLYVTSIPQFMVNRISIPVGFVAGPQEASELYKLYYLGLQNVVNLCDRLHILPGPAL